MNLKEIFQAFQQDRSVGLTWPFPADLGEWGAIMQVAQRSLFLFQEIHDQDDPDANELGVGHLIKGLVVLDQIDQSPIRLYINSPGGSIAAGMALINVMRDLASPVHTFVVGLAASMAGVVAVSGIRRLAYPTARWMLHRGRTSAHGDAEDLEIEAKEMRTVDSYADQVIINSSGGKIDYRLLSKLQRKNYWIGCEEAMKHGLLDEIVTPKQGWDNWIPEKGKTSFDVSDDEPTK